MPLILLWLLGAPLGLIIILFLIGVGHWRKVRNYRVPAAGRFPLPADSLLRCAKSRCRRRGQPLRPWPPVTERTMSRQYPLHACNEPIEDR